MRSGKMLVACAVVAIAMTACSSSSSTKSSSTTPATKSSTHTTTATGGSDGGGGDFCAKVRNQADAFTITGFSGKSTDELKRTYEGLADRLDQLQADAPDAIKDDLATFAAFSKKLQAKLADADYDPSKLSIAGLADLYSAKTTTALQHISEYFTKNCNFTTPSS